MISDLTEITAVEKRKLDLEQAAGCIGFIKNTSPCCIAVWPAVDRQKPIYILMQQYRTCFLIYQIQSDLIHEGVSVS